MARKIWKETKQQPGTVGPGFLLIFFPFPVGHPEHKHCIGAMIPLFIVSEILNPEPESPVRLISDSRSGSRAKIITPLFTLSSLWIWLEGWENFNLIGGRGRGILTMQRVILNFGWPSMESKAGRQCQGRQLYFRLCHPLSTVDNSRWLLQDLATIIDIINLTNLVFWVTS